MLEKLARKYALHNAVLHEGKAHEGSVLGKLISEKPELKSDIKEAMKVIKAVVAEVNALGLDEQMAQLEREAPELLERKSIEKDTFTDLPNVQGQVVMRFAPGPSGPLHIGHTRAAILNDEYVRHYGGRYIIRLEDTNPAKIDPGAYDSIEEDLKWLGVQYHELAVQSERFEIYYDHARQLLSQGNAYICRCEVEDWRSAKLKMQPCPHRELAVETQLEGWEKMLGGAFNEGEASFMVKTDLEHPNPAVRDFVGARIVKTPHPRTGDRYIVYPLYNFSVAVDDHLMGMTHVLRGKDHLNNTHRQEYVYNHFGWDKPVFVHYGLVQMEDITLKTTVIKEGIANGVYSGWNDVRLATLKTMAQRGIQPEAIREYWREVGIKEVDIRFSWDNLYAYNKDIVDPRANRYFFVWNPQSLVIKGIERLEGHAPLHPDHPERGVRKVVLTGAKCIRLFITGDDFEKNAPGEKIRLKDLCNVEFTSKNSTQYIGDDLTLIKEGVRIIHWVGGDNVPTRLYMPDGAVKEGFCEPISKEDLGKVVQFERLGFVRIWAMNGGYEAYFAHRCYIS
jgi:glutamyl-tRNA synthetase